MLHDWVIVWFGWVRDWGYVGVFVLMAMESSIIPVPSELVMPPAAFWAAQGRMSFAGVVLAGTLGSGFGSLVSYYGARIVGLLFLNRYGKFLLLPPEKLKLAEDWVAQYGTGGIFWARMLPIVRHLISMPAGVLGMPLGRFMVATLSGAGIWCLVLAAFGQAVIGDSPQLLESPEEMMHVIRSKMGWIIAGIAAFSVSYAAMKWFRAGPSKRSPKRSKRRK